jgi:ketosteroid isomerase-like protein
MHRAGGVQAMMRRVLVALALASGALTGSAACASRGTSVSAGQRADAERAIRSEVVAAYDFTRPNVPDTLMALYAPTGRIVSASAGRIVTNRDSLRAGIQAFWDNVGRNMRSPRVEWTQMYIAVLAPNAAVMTATYRIPHTQPNGMSHVIGGAWTAAFQRIGSRWYIVQEHLSDDPTLSAAMPALMQMPADTARR